MFMKRDGTASEIKYVTYQTFVNYLPKYNV